MPAPARTTVSRHGRGRAGRLTFTGAVLVMAILSGAGPTTTPARAAAITPTTPPLQVVLAGPTVQVKVNLVSGSTIAATGLHVSVVQGPGVVLWAGGASPDLVATGTLGTAALTVGAQTWSVIDAGNGRVSSLPVLVLRQSRLTSTTLTAAGHGKAIISVGLQHYDAASGRWAASKLSPVQVLVWRAGRWTPVVTLTTDAATGRATGTLSLPSGRQQVRVQRPEGATVTAVTSATIPVTLR